MTREAAAGARDLYHLDECGFAPTLPTSYTWARVGTRPIVPYEAPQGRRVNVIGALAAVGPRPRFVYQSRRSGQGRLDSAAFLDFVCRAVAQLPAPWDALAPDYVRERPCTIALDNYCSVNPILMNQFSLAEPIKRSVTEHYSVHHSKVVQAAEPVLARAGVEFFFLPPYSPELSAIEPVWHQTKYHEITTRSYADGAALHTAVDAALDQRAALYQNATQNFPRAA